MLQTLLPLVEKLLDKCEDSKALLHEDESILLQLILQKYTPDAAALLQEESKCWKEMLRVFYLRSAVCPGHPAPMLTMIGQVSAIKWVFATCLEAVYKKCFVASNPSEALIAGTVIFFFPLNSWETGDFGHFRAILNSFVRFLTFPVWFQTLSTFHFTSHFRSFRLVSEGSSWYRTSSPVFEQFRLIWDGFILFSEICLILDTSVHFWTPQSDLDKLN